MSALDIEAQRKEKAQQLAANDARYKDLVAANEKKKAEIKRKDELRKLK